MKRLMLLTVAMVGLLTAAQADTKTKVACPVIPSQSVDIKEATGKHMYADYKGHRYYFCCVSCPEAFRKNPAKYAKETSSPKSNPKKAR